MSAHSNSRLWESGQSRSLLDLRVNRWRIVLLENQFALGALSEQLAKPLISAKLAAGKVCKGETRGRDAFSDSEKVTQTESRRNVGCSSHLDILLSHVESEPQCFQTI